MAPVAGWLGGCVGAVCRALAGCCTLPACGSRLPSLGCVLFNQLTN